MNSFHHTRRKCLKCDKQFLSEGPANRLCGRCNDDNRKHAAQRVEFILPERNLKLPTN